MNLLAFSMTYNPILRAYCQYFTTDGRCCTAYLLSATSVPVGTALVLVLGWCSTVWQSPQPLDCRLVNKGHGGGERKSSRAGEGVGQEGVKPAELAPLDPEHPYGAFHHYSGHPWFYTSSSADAESSSPIVGLLTCSAYLGEEDKSSLLLSSH